jgi:predicted ATPase
MCENDWTGFTGIAACYSCPYWRSLDVLTRIEIDGFKSFENFGLDLSPFAVILGSNASGKSNLFDAIQLLSHLVSSDLRTAVRGLRGEAISLFRQTSPGEQADCMSFAVEVLLDPVVRDPWDREVKLTHTRIRYEVKIERTTDERGIERLIVVSERALPILGKNDRWRPFGRSCHRTFRDSFLLYSRRAPWLETRMEGGKASFHIHQDGSAGRTRPGHAAEATVLSSVTTTDFPHLYALREEFRSWRLLQLDPMGLRKPAALEADEMLLSDGSNLAAVLYRIRSETCSSDQPKGVIPDIVAELAAVIPGVLDLEVEMNKEAHEYRTRIMLRDGLKFPASVISDGTLRVLALLTLLKDPRHRGVVCFEEPENGIHPARLGELVRRLRDMVVDPTSSENASSEPLSQLLMNSHSPVVLSALREAGSGQLLFADMSVVADPVTKKTRQKTRIRPVTAVDQGEIFQVDTSITRFEVQRYLDTVNVGA